MTKKEVLEMGRKAKTEDDLAKVKQTEEATEQTNEPIEEQAEAETPKIQNGVVTGCEKLNVRVDATTNAPVQCIISKGDEVEVDGADKTETFYHVITTAGIEGFCMKKYIKLLK